LAICRKQLIKIFGVNLETVLCKNTLLWAINNHTYFSQLTEIEINRWVNKC